MHRRPRRVRGAALGGDRRLDRRAGRHPRAAGRGAGRTRRSASSIVQHIASGFELGFADWLNKELPFDVRLAQDGEVLRRGAVRLAPGGSHLRLESGGVLRLDSDTPARRGHRPSVDEMFLSCAEHCPREVAGVLMTGMGSDGVEGLLALRQAGGITLVQDEASSVVFGMPRVALERGAADVALPPRALARALVRLWTRGGAVNRRVLVVDDSEVTRAILARTLRGAGFEVLEARDGAEGAMTALRERPAVVVTDLEMPTMDGFPLLRLLKADPASAHIPVLILTSHGEAASRYWGLRTGADAYLTKDYRRSELVATVTRLVEAADAVRRDAAAAPPAASIRSRSGRWRCWRGWRATSTPRCSRRRWSTPCWSAAWPPTTSTRRPHSALETLGQVVDAQLLAVAVAELDAGDGPDPPPGPGPADRRRGAGRTCSPSRLDLRAGDAGRGPHRRRAGGGARRRAGAGGLAPPAGARRHRRPRLPAARPARVRRRVDRRPGGGADRPPGAGARQRPPVAAAARAVDPRRPDPPAQPPRDLRPPDRGAGARPPLQVPA